MLLDVLSALRLSRIAGTPEEIALTVQMDRRRKCMLVRCHRDSNSTSCSLPATPAIAKLCDPPSFLERSVPQARVATGMIALLPSMKWIDPGGVRRAIKMPLEPHAWMIEVPPNARERPERTVAIHVTTGLGSFGFG